MNHGVKDPAKETTEQIGVLSFRGRVELFAEDKLLDCSRDSFFPYDICEKSKVGSVISIVFSAIKTRVPVSNKYLLSATWSLKFSSVIGPGASDIGRWKELSNLYAALMTSPGAPSDQIASAR